MKNNCLTLVDFQNDFVAPNGALTFDNGKGDLGLMKRMNSFFEHLPKNYFDRVIITYDTHDAKTYQGTEEAKTFPIHCATNTKGWHLAVNPKLVLNKIKTVQHLKKNTYDMWAETIDKVDNKVLEGLKNVTIIGVASDICNKAALDGWLKQGVRVTIIDDLTRGIFEQTKEVIAQPKYQVARRTGMLNITTSTDFLKKLNVSTKQGR